MRYVSLPADIPALYSLMQQPYSNDPSNTLFSPEQLLALYTRIDRSESSNAFLVFADGGLLFTLEFHEARKHEVQPGFRWQVGDFCLQAYFPPGLPSLPFIQNCLRHCLQFFFGFQNVRRILAPLYPGPFSEEVQNILRGAGFCLFGEKGQAGGPDFYGCTRSALFAQKK
jgi:hypothetical protein